MANKPKAQGTAFERHIRTAAQLLGRTARRLALTGTKHEPDVEVDGVDTLPALFWKAYDPANGRKKRRATNLVVLREQDFWRLYALDRGEQFGLVIQAKASQTLGVKRTLLGLVHWVDANSSEAQLDQRKAS